MSLPEHHITGACNAQPTGVLRLPANFLPLSEVPLKTPKWAGPQRGLVSAHSVYYYFFAGRVGPQFLAPGVQNSWIQLQESTYVLRAKPAHGKHRSVGDNTPPR